MRKVSLDHLETSLGRRWCDPPGDGGGGQQRHLVCTPTLVAEPIGTPEDPQSAAVRRTTNKCCQKPKQDFSPQPKQDFSPAGKRISS